MKTIHRAATAALTLIIGCGASHVPATFDLAFREADRRAAGARELERILTETDADRREAELVAALLGWV